MVFLGTHSIAWCLPHLLLLSLVRYSSGNAGLFTYYETPLDGLGQRGPSNWRDILLPVQNQCGGIGQTTGFGQSPIRIPHTTAETCNTNLDGYTYEGGTCTWQDLEYVINTNSVLVRPKFDSTCTLGRMKIPGNDNFFDALQFHIHTISEHSVDGKHYPNELHVVHRESTGSSFAVFGMFIDIDQDTPDQNNEAFEPFLLGLEATAEQSEQFCAIQPSGTGIFTGNSILSSRQMKIECPRVASNVDMDSIIMDNDSMFPIAEAILPDGTLSDVYRDLPTPGFGIYSYRGGLTTPPCTEIVHWNLLDTPMYLAKSQVDRLYNLILCYVERSTCQHGTIANEFGGTNRPPQPLNGRTIIHRCENATKNEQGPLEVPLPPKLDVYTPQGRSNPWIALLFPWFVVAVGVAVYYLLSRYLHALPYTAVMFMVGTIMGAGIMVWENTTDQLSSSIRMWNYINAELLLLAFLPGLLFRDAYSLNFHLFRQSILQCLIFAFPMVLAGTTLLACVGFYILPYGWSFSLAMTFGAILSATDPVAVSALLNEVGAPPRLKMHISGESLLNDGSAIVFFTIFSAKFLFENQIPSRVAGFMDIDAATGVALFFRMSLGAVAIGLGFGIILHRILYLLHRRFNYEESIVQVTATITVAYLTYYVAEPVCSSSGVIAVVTCGIFTKAYGSPMINDPVMMDKFWELVEHLLNTVIFTLGGVVWGTVVSNSDPSRSDTFSAGDWGYLVLTYVIMMIIRTVLMFLFLPLISKIGLKSDWKETVFLSWGGLRGAVGIALAIALDNEVIRDSFPGDPRREYTSQLFKLVGGVAFMTLAINGTSCGPLLRKLGLADSSEARSKVISRYRHNLMHYTLDRLLCLLGDERYSEVDFAVVRELVPSVSNVPFEELKRAVKRNKNNTPPHSYMCPNLSTFRIFLTKDEADELEDMAHLPFKTRFHSLVSMASVIMPDDIDTHQIVSNETLIELRRIFIELVRGAYDEQIRNGELNSREGLVVFYLNQSLELASDAVTNGDKLCDWEYLLENSAYAAPPTSGKSTLDLSQGEGDYEQTKVELVRTMAFITAHQRAQQLFKDDFCGGHGIRPSEGQVLEESYEVVKLAKESLSTLKQSDRQIIASHLLCEILLNNGASYVAGLIARGLLREQEGESYFHELQHSLALIDKKHNELLRESSILKKSFRRLKSFRSGGGSRNLMQGISSRSLRRTSMRTSIKQSVQLRRKSRLEQDKLPKGIPSQVSFQEYDSTKNESNEIPKRTSRIRFSDVDANLASAAAAFGSKDTAASNASPSLAPTSTESPPFPIPPVGLDDSDDSESPPEF